jgi:broad specificity phosphatase PhoE
MSEYTTASMESAMQSLKTPGESPPLPKDESGEATLFVFRHGETEHNKNKIFCGRFDSPLTERGVEQAKELGKLMKGLKVDVALTPHLQRCTKTLEEVLAYHTGTRIESEDLLLERDYGDLTNTSKTELFEKDPELWLKYRRSWDFPVPNGETLRQVKEQRIYPLCEKLKNRMGKEKISIAISATNNTMRLIRMYFENLSIQEMLDLENPLASDYAAYKIA